MRCLVFILLCLLSCTGIYAQTAELARNYLDQAEYEKALSLYRELLKENPGNSDFFYGMLTAHQQLEDFAAAEAFLREKMSKSAGNPAYLIELGHNFDLQQKPEESKKYYLQALEFLEQKPAYTYSIARSFEKYSLLDYTAKAYETGLRLNPDMRYELPLARIYGEQNRMEEMFSTYTGVIEKEPDIMNSLMREISRYITEDPQSPGNQAFRKVLLKRLQQNPELLYNELLAWLYVQQKELDKAFVQEKAIYRRNNQDLQRIIQLTVIARSEGEVQTAKDILAYIISETPSENILLQARQLLLDMKVQEAVKKDYSAIEAEFRELLGTYGTGPATFGLQLSYAGFLAFKAGKTEQAVELLKSLSEGVLSDFQKAEAKMLLGDILVLEEKFNTALIYYSQVQNLVKNEEMAQNARFKVAKTSYFKGDFEWAKNQLDILKASTSQLIANDALELSLLIHENRLEDSTAQALKLYARADLLAFQNKPAEALEVLEKVLREYKGEKIEDEALLKKAKLSELTGDWIAAEASYLQILEFFKEDILADNAAYSLALLYRKMDKPDKAKDFFERIIFDFPDSIYFVDARKNFRMLRGDAVE